MKIHLKKVLSCILAAAMILAMLPMQYAVATAQGEPGITLGSAAFSAGVHYFDSAAVTGDNLRTILISFSDSVTSGDTIVLPATPSGFTVSASSAGNNYTKRINLNAGIAASDVQDYIRGVGFTIAGQAQTVQITVTTEVISQDTFYSADTGHYYQFVSDTTSTWIQAYDAARVKTYMGRSGYLTTVMSLEEDAFVNALSNGKTGWLGGTILSNTGTSAGSMYYTGFTDNSVVSTGWYWACGPEKGTTFYNVNTLYPNNTDTAFANQKDALNSTYYNWSRGIANEPNNNTAGSFYMNSDYETCLSTLKVSGRTGKHGTAFAWNDIRYNFAGSDSYRANGYVVEYGDQSFGDSGSASNTFATAGGTLEAVYTATVNTNTDGAPAAAPGSVELKQGGTTAYALSGSATGIYTASAINGTYDVYINNEDTGKDIVVNNGNGSATVNYYTVSFFVSNAGTASGSTVSATAGGASITSGTAVLAGKAVTVAAAGAGADTYTYLWSGPGTSGETSAAIAIPVLSGTVNASCQVTGTTAPQTHAADIYTFTDGALAPAPGIVELKQGGVTVYTAENAATGVYTASAVNGTYDIYINNEDTGKGIQVRGVDVGEAIDYYTVSFAVADAGAASGSTVSATAGGTSITSGTAVLAGKAVTVTAAGAGADTYTYLWSGPGTSGETSAAIAIPALSGTVNASCQVTGTTAPQTHAADIYTFTDGALAPAPGIVELKQSGVTVYTAGNAATGVYTASAVNGTYDIYINNEDTCKDIQVRGVDVGEAVNYYTVSFAVADTGTASGSTVSATAGGTSITSGTAVLAGKAVTVTAAGSGADTYAYLWSGAGTGGETTASITIPALGGTVNALCTVTGTANTFALGTLEEEADDTTISAEGLFTQDARLVIIPLKDGEADREELESLLSGKQTAAAFEVHIEPADAFRAPLTLSFHMGTQYNGRSVYILHRLHSGSVEQFTVTVANGEAVITVQELSPFLLTVDPPVSITSQPQSVTVVTGQTATFAVTATGTEPLTYQWQKRTGTNASWEDISGAVRPEHTTSQANLSNSGFQYRVIITDAYGRSVTSEAAVLTVTKAPEPPATGDHSQPALYMALIIFFMLTALLLLRKRKAM